MPIVALPVSSSLTLDNRVSTLETRISELENELKELKLQDIKPLENTFVIGILNKIAMLKNIIKENINDKDGEIFSGTLIAVEKIEEIIRTTKSVTQKQLKELNDIYTKEKTYQKI